MSVDGEGLADRLAVAVTGVAEVVAAAGGVPVEEARNAIEAWLLDQYAAVFPVEVRVQRYVCDPEGCPRCRPGWLCCHHVNAARLQERVAELRAAAAARDEPVRAVPFVGQTDRPDPGRWAGFTYEGPVYRDDPAGAPTAEQLAAAPLFFGGRHPRVDLSVWGLRLLAAERDRPAGCTCDFFATADGEQLARVVDHGCRVHGDDAVHRAIDFPPGCTCGAVVRDSDRPDDPDPQRVAPGGCAVHGDDGRGG